MGSWRAAAATVAIASAILASGSAADAGGGWGSDVVGVSTLGGQIWTVSADGDVDSPAGRDVGDAGALALNQPMVGIAATSSGAGYWLIAADGGVFAYGDAGFWGSTGDIRLNRPVVGLAPDPDGEGYWFVATDGGVFAYDAPFFGSTGNLTLNRPINGMAATASGLGYWMVADDGGIFAFGDAGFFGSLGGVPLGGASVIGMEATASGQGYWLFLDDGRVEEFGDATPLHPPLAADITGAAISRDADGRVVGITQVDRSGRRSFTPIVGRDPEPPAPTPDPDGGARPLPARVGSTSWTTLAESSPSQVPTRFDRCQTIPVYVNTALRPSWFDDVEATLARLGDVSGHRFGPIQRIEPLSSSAWFRDPRRGILVTVNHPDDPDPGFNRTGAIGVGGQAVRYLSPDPDATPEPFVEKGRAAITSEWSRNGPTVLHEGWGDGPGTLLLSDGSEVFVADGHRDFPGQQVISIRDLLAHEIGHALGLGHAEPGTPEVMTPADIGVGVDLGPGTRWALDALGRRFACDPGATGATAANAPAARVVVHETLDPAPSR